MMCSASARRASISSLAGELDRSACSSARVRICSTRGPRCRNEARSTTPDLLAHLAPGRAGAPRPGRPACGSGCTPVRVRRPGSRSRARHARRTGRPVVFRSPAERTRSWAPWSRPRRERTVPRRATCPHPHTHRVLLGRYGRPLWDALHDLPGGCRYHWPGTQTARADTGYPVSPRAVCCPPTGRDPVVCSGDPPAQLCASALTLPSGGALGGGRRVGLAPARGRCRPGRRASDRAAR